MPGLVRSTTIDSMKVDPDELVDAIEAAPLIGLSNPNGVSVYRKRYENFPEPVVEKRQAVLWRRRDIEAWATGPRVVRRST